jgi:hypothetical protein
MSMRRYFNLTCTTGMSLLRLGDEEVKNPKDVSIEMSRQKFVQNK